MYVAYCQFTVRADVLCSYVCVCVCVCVRVCRVCTGMSKLAYDLLTAEDSAEWACDECIATKAIPTVKMVPKK